MLSGMSPLEMRIQSGQVRNRSAHKVATPGGLSHAL